MEQLKALRTFIAVADHASFAEAGRRLGLSATTVTRTIASLEASLGTPLLMRTTRSVRLTDEGALFLDRCRLGIAEIDQAYDAARGGGLDPRGTLTVTAPVMFGRLHILPIVIQLLKRHPGLHVRLLLLDRVVHLVEEGIDVAVRIADLPDSSLHMLRIGEVRRVLSASPEYIRDRGEPVRLADMRHHDLIAIEDEAGPARGWGVDEGKRGELSRRLTVNSMEAGIDAAVAGLGIVRTLSYQVSGHIADGRLQRLLENDPTPALPLSLLFQRGRRDTPNIRAFVEFVRASLQRQAL